MKSAVDLLGVKQAGKFHALLDLVQGHLVDPEDEDAKLTLLEAISVEGLASEASLKLVSEYQQGLRTTPGLYRGLVDLQKQLTDPIHAITDESLAAVSNAPKPTKRGKAKAPKEKAPGEAPGTFGVHDRPKGNPFRRGSTKFVLVEVLRDGQPRTKEEIEIEAREKYRAKISTTSLAEFVKELESPVSWVDGVTWTLYREARTLKLEQKDEDAGRPEDL